jgi:phosphoglycolate phosphatase-like HAD superfamily hydrolase
MGVATDLLGRPLKLVRFLDPEAQVVVSGGGMLESMDAPLAIFDIDGTLCNTVEVDDECFCRVASEVLQISLEPLSWEGAPHVTDAGILDWLWRRYRRRGPTEAEVEAFVGRHEAALTRELEQDPSRFAAMPGAAPLLDCLRREGWDVAIATGGWGRMARLKLHAADLPVDLLLASSDDSQDRVEVFELAKRRADVIYRGVHERVVLIGDGLWDIHVAAQLGWALLGVGCGERGDRLRSGGANAVVDNFLDGDGVLRLLRELRAPPIR